MNQGNSSHSPALPDLHCPLLDDALTAENALTEAVQRNRESGATVEGVSPEQARVLMEWISYKTRRGLLTWDRERIAARPKNSPVTFFEQPNHVAGYCIHAMQMVSTQAQALGLSMKCHHTRELLDITDESHAFAVVSIPVLKDGAVALQPYLVDPTFRQLFDARGTGSWAKTLMQTPDGKVLADTLLRQGFTALDTHSAELYLLSHATPANAEYAGDIMAVLAKNSTMPTQWYEGHEKENFPAKKYAVDLRIPSLAAKDAPLADMIPAMQVHAKKLVYGKVGEMGTEIKPV